MLKLIPFFMVISVLGWGVVKLTTKPSSYVVLRSFASAKAQDASKYDDETLERLATLQQEGFFFGKKVGIWTGNKGIEAHGEVFSLWIAAKYLLRTSKDCFLTETLKEAERCDYVLFPWKSNQLKKSGYSLIHDENWLYIYAKNSLDK